MIKILVIGSGKLATFIKKKSPSGTIITVLSKNDLNITSQNNVADTISHFASAGYTHVIHTAAIGKPMSVVDDNLNLAIATNIVGTSYIAQACNTYDLKLIYISTDYVYSPEATYHSEDSSVKPVNKYAWSKLGGECAVQLTRKFLILRCALTDIPFRHKVAFTNIYKNSISHEDCAKYIHMLLNSSGIVNVGGDCISVYDFANKYGAVEKAECDNGRSVSIEMNVSKLKNCING